MATNELPEFVRRNKRSGEKVERIPAEEFGNIKEAYRHTKRGKVTGWSLRTTDHMTVFEQSERETLLREGGA